MVPDTFPILLDHVRMGTPSAASRPNLAKHRGKMHSKIQYVTVQSVNKSIM